MHFEQAAPPSDWVPPRRTVVVATTPRCGSAWLGGLISSTGQLGRPAEWFNNAILASPEQVMAAANTIRTRGSTANGIAGVKLFPYYLEPLLRHIRFHEWFPGAVWLHLQRRDLLGQAVSLWRAYNTGSWHEYASEEKDKPASDRGAQAAPPPYDARAIHLCLMQLVAFDADWRAFFARTGITPMTVVYEDALDNPDGTIRRLAALLDVSLPSEPIAHVSRLAVQRDEASQAIRERFRAETGDPDRPFRLLMPPDRLERRASNRIVVPRTVSNLVRLLRGQALKC
jgi:LPS sulfotransferase NodH